MQIRTALRHCSCGVKIFIVLTTISAYGVHSGPAAAVVASPAVLDSAVTKDDNGNGYLDGIELWFSGPVLGLVDPQTGLINPAVTFSITYTIVNIDVIRYVDFRTANDIPVRQNGNSYLVKLREDSMSAIGLPQTAWRPTLTISGLGTLTTSVHCVDGAGPVIWSVVKTIRNVCDRAQDAVRVIFSEPVQGPGGTALSLKSLRPQDIFIVYRRGPGDSAFVKDSLVLGPNPQTGVIIGGFDSLRNDSTLEFTMSNGNDLSSSNFLSINAGANAIFDDRTKTGGGFGVPPVAMNQKVRVKCLDDGSTRCQETNEPQRKCGGCGTGVGLAFIPPLGFRIASAVKRRRKR